MKITNSDELTGHDLLGRPGRTTKLNSEDIVRILLHKHVFFLDDQVLDHTKSETLSNFPKVI